MRLVAYGVVDWSQVGAINIRTRILTQLYAFPYLCNILPVIIEHNFLLMAPYICLSWHFEVQMSLNKKRRFMEYNVLGSEKVITILSDNS